MLYTCEELVLPLVEKPMILPFYDEFLHIRSLSGPVPLGHNHLPSKTMKYGLLTFLLLLLLTAFQAKEKEEKERGLCGFKGKEG